jgi:RimJ/RimL family protein N-acetyltransferase
MNTRNIIAGAIVFHTGRITVRDLVDDDLDFLAKMLGDAEVMRYWPRPLTRPEAQQWLRRHKNVTPTMPADIGLWWTMKHTNQWARQACL